MGVYIKGMEMPRSCAECPVNMNICKRGYKYLLAHMELYDQRADDCPISSVPPHGRLIDADAVFKRLQKQAMSVWGNGNPRYQIVLEVMDAIRFAPTVIPAEEGE